MNRRLLSQDRHRPSAPAAAPAVWGGFAALGGGGYANTDIGQCSSSLSQRLQGSGDPARRPANGPERSAPASAISHHLQQGNRRRAIRRRFCMEGRALTCALPQAGGLRGANLTPSPTCGGAVRARFVRGRTNAAPVGWKVFYVFYFPVLHHLGNHVRPSSHHSP